MLSIIPTPIGNLKDITLRAVETLHLVDAVICEDSRRTGLLLQHLGIHKPLIVLNDFNEPKMFPQILNQLIEGKHLGLVSDAGTPLISDPGYKLIRQTIAAGIEVDSLPGPTAAITALTLSTLPPDKFMYLGYLPEKSGQRKTMLENTTKISELIKTTFIVYVAPHKLVRTLEDFVETFGDLEIVLARELTKMHQQVEKKLVSEFLEQYKKSEPRGEYVLLYNFETKTKAE